jgi:predicted enzyme related to lactoylglutathione lyase
MKNIKFKAGKNIAIKVPTHQYEQTVEFYRDIIGLPQIRQEKPQIVFKFGDKNLWIDKQNYLSQAEIWFEIECENINEAKKYFKAKRVVRRDEVEKLPPDFKGFWIASPGDIIHLITES